MCNSIIVSMYLRNRLIFFLHYECICAMLNPCSCFRFDLNVLKSIKWNFALRRPSNQVIKWVLVTIILLGWEESSSRDKKFNKSPNIMCNLYFYLLCTRILDIVVKEVINAQIKAQLILLIIGGQTMLIYQSYMHYHLFIFDFIRIHVFFLLLLNHLESILNITYSSSQNYTLYSVYLLKNIYKLLSKRHHHNSKFSLGVSKCK